MSLVGCGSNIKCSKEKKKHMCKCFYFIAQLGHYYKRKMGHVLNVLEDIYLFLITLHYVWRQFESVKSIKILLE